MLNKVLTKKAIFKSEHADEFFNSKCCLTISVGQAPHEKEKFRATLASVNHHFSACTIMVCDSLQRHTMQIMSDSKENAIHAYSNILGEEWIARNLLYINQLDIPYHILRWDQWLEHINFGQKYDLINTLYSRDQLFETAIYNTVNHFLKRKEGKPVVNQETAYHLSKTHLLEKCAVMLLLADEGYPFEIYPHDRNLALDYVYKNVISLWNSNLMRAVSIKFKNRVGESPIA